MCEIMERYLKEAEKAGKEAGEKAERIKAVQKLIVKGCDRKFILELDYSPEEYQEAEALLSVTI